MRSDVGPGMLVEVWSRIVMFFESCWDLIVGVPGVQVSCQISLVMV